MLLRLAAPAIAVFVLGMTTAVIVEALASLPMLSGTLTQEGLGNMGAVGTSVVSLVAYGMQMLRYWRWTRDKGDDCFICSCLPGREREGCFGPYRKSGCGKTTLSAACDRQAIAPDCVSLVPAGQST
ncbi:hypothetical protein [Luteibacter sp. RCC_6_2]|uniref:hypothetical protein n=1 Tax=Luteibacter sp. RCC_6_2 TaxID=3239223 RepID=UPI003526B983